MISSVLKTSFRGFSIARKLALSYALGGTFLLEFSKGADVCFISLIESMLSGRKQEKDSSTRISNQAVKSSLLGLRSGGISRKST